MSKLRRTALVLAAALVTVIGAPIAYLFTLDANEYRDDLAAVVSRATGRTAALGRLELDLSLEPRLVIHDLALADARWTGAPWMLNVGRVEADLALLEMLSGRLRVQRLVIADAVLGLTRDAQGRANWAFFGPFGDEAEPGWRFFPDLGSVNLTRSVIRIQDDLRGFEGALRIDVLDATTIADGTRVDLDLAGRIAGTDVRVTGNTGYPADLLAGATPWPVDVEVHASGLTARAAGTVDPRNGQLDADLELEGAVTSLASRAGLVLPADEHLELRAHISGDRRTLALAGVAATLNDATRIEGELDIELSGPRPRVAGRLSADRLDLPDLADRYASGGSTRPVVEVALPLDWVQRIDGRVELAIATLSTSTLAAEDVRAVVEIEDGRLDVSPAAATVAGGRIGATLGVDSTIEPPAVHLTLRASGLSTRRLLATMSEDPFLSGPLHLGAELDGRGRKLASLVQTLSGDARIFLEDGQVRTAAVEPLVGGLVAMLDSSGDGETGWTRLNCLAADFEIARGMATRRVLLADTRHATILGEGRIDLARERLELKLTPRPKTTTLNLAVPVHVGGTFARPTFAPGVAATARRVGGVVGAVLFPPAALAVFADFGTGEDHPCRNVARGRDGVQQLAQRAAPAREEPAEKNEFGSVVNDIGRGLQRMFGD